VTNNVRHRDVRYEDREQRGESCLEHGSQVTGVASSGSSGYAGLDDPPHVLRQQIEGYGQQHNVLDQDRRTPNHAASPALLDRRPQLKIDLMM
jgi:hypothetical protein